MRLSLFIYRYSSSFICHRFINKKPIDAGYSALTQKAESSDKALKFRFDDRVRITKHKNTFRKSYTKNWSRDIFINDSVLETNPWTNEIKYLKGEKNNRKFLRKQIFAQ